MTDRDWADEAWVSFFSVLPINAAEALGAQGFERLLKEAWMHGARTGIEKSLELLKETQLKVLSE